MIFYLLFAIFFNSTISSCDCVNAKSKRMNIFSSQRQVLIRLLSQQYLFVRVFA